MKPSDRVRRVLLRTAPAVALLLLCGCAAQVYRREHLVDRIMSFDAAAKEDARRMKALEAREGSTGGIGGAGGGCACK